MTEAALKAPSQDKQYLTDAELIRWMGVPEKVAREAFRELDRNPRSGFPPKQKLWGDRRYLPADNEQQEKTMDDLIDSLKKCDSWSNVEDHISETNPNGNYGVTVFFNSREEAAWFHQQMVQQMGGGDR